MCIPKPGDAQISEDSFEGLGVGCIEAEFCTPVLILQCVFDIYNIYALLHRSNIIKIERRDTLLAQILTTSCQHLENFQT